MIRRLLPNARVRRVMSGIATILFAATRVGAAVPSDEPTAREKAERAEAAGERLAAIQFYREHLQASPADLDARLMLARALVELGATIQALDEIERCLEEAPDHAPVQLASGLLLHQLGCFPVAEICFQRVAELQPGDGLVEDFLGQVEARAGRLRAARHHFERSRRLLPRWPAPALGLARLELRQGQPAAALQRLEELHTAHPEDLETRLLLAEAMQGCGMRRLAVDALRQIVEGAGEEAAEIKAGALRQLGELYDEAQQWEPAVACFEGAILSSDQPHPILDDLGLLYFRTGRREEGVALMQLAVQMDQRTSDRLRLAQELDQLGRGEEALAQLQAAAARGACRPALLWALARQEERDGQAASARRAFARLLEVERRHPQLGQQAAFLWMVAERSLGSELEGIRSEDRGQRYLGLARQRTRSLEAGGRAALEATARREGLPARAVVEARLPVARESRE